ncbi:SDR family oxidoreductase [Methanosphaera sp.]
MGPIIKKIHTRIHKKRTRIWKHNNTHQCSRSITIISTNQNYTRSKSLWNSSTTRRSRKNNKKKGGVGVTISSQSGKRMPQLTRQEDEQLAITPTEELLDLEILQEENINDTLHAYQLAKRCNEKRVMYEAYRWGERKARINSVSPGIIVTPLAIDEFNGPRGDFYKNMFAKCPAQRPATVNEVAM